MSSMESPAILCVNPAFMQGSRWDLREQVLSNVRCLWPLMEEDRINFGRASSARALPTSFKVVVTSGGPWCRAVVVYGGEISGGVLERTFLFAESEKFMTEREALYALLAVTEKRLNDFWGHLQHATGTRRSREGMGGNGAFFE